jgi:hypothetical protein
MKNLLSSVVLTIIGLLSIPLVASANEPGIGIFIFFYIFYAIPGILFIIGTLLLRKILSKRKVVSTHGVLKRLFYIFVVVDILLFPIIKIYPPLVKEPGIGHDLKSSFILIAFTIAAASFIIIHILRHIPFRWNEFTSTGTFKAFAILFIIFTLFSGYQMFSEIAANEGRFCDVMINIPTLGDNAPLYTRNACFMKQIETTHVSATCKKLWGKFYEGSCYGQIATQTNDPSLCANVADERGHRGACYQFVGIENSNPDACAEIPASYGNSYCYLEVAKARNDSKLCDPITLDYPRDSCYEMFSINNKELGLCAKMVSKDIKQSCLIREKEQIENMSANEKSNEAIRSQFFSL